MADINTTIGATGAALTAVGNAVKSTQKVLDNAFKNGIQKNLSAIQGMKTSSNDISRPAASPSHAYRISVICSDLDIAVVAFMPENINISVSSSYGTPFEQLNLANFAGSAIGGNIGQAVASIGGVTGMLQAMTIQVWQGGSGITMSIPITLTDNDDPTNITAAIMQLYQLCAPSAPEGLFSLMTPPGPSLKALDKLRSIASAAGTAIAQSITGSDNAGGGFEDAVKSTLAEGMVNQITVAIGNYLTFPSVVVNNLDVNFTNVLSGDEFDNTPWRADLTLTFSTLWNPSVEDLFEIFGFDRPNSGT